MKQPPSVALKCSQVFLSSRKAEMCPAEAVPVSDKFSSGVSCSATGYELSVHGSAVYSTDGIFKEKHT